MTSTSSLLFDLLSLSLAFSLGQGLVFDYFINPENGEVVRWSDRVSYGTPVFRMITVKMAVAEYVEILNLRAPSFKFKWLAARLGDQRPFHGSILNLSWSVFFTVL